jgi:hypothetical protein
MKKQQLDVSKALRNISIISHRIDYEHSGDPLAGKQVNVYVTVQRGFDLPNEIAYQIEEADLDDFLAELADDPFNKLRDWKVAELFWAKNTNAFSIDEEEWLEKLHTILREGKIIEEDSSIVATEAVINSYTQEERQHFVDQFASKYEVAMITHFATTKYSYTSLVSYAARICFNHYISNDDFSSGYLFREMLMIQTQEAELLRKREQLENAGQKGGVSSGYKKERRLNALLQAMEKLVSQEPAYRKLPKQCGKLALIKAAEADPDLWSQGRHQLPNYLTILSSEPPYKPRYDALFFKTA